MIFSLPVLSVPMPVGKASLAMSLRKVDAACERMQPRYAPSIAKALALGKGRTSASLVTTG